MAATHKCPRGDFSGSEKQVNDHIYSKRIQEKGSGIHKNVSWPGAVQLSNGGLNTVPSYQPYVPAPAPDPAQTTLISPIVPDRLVPVATVPVITVTPQTVITPVVKHTTTSVAPLLTQAEKEAQFYAAATKAINDAKDGNPETLRNFDKFFGITRPEEEYTKEFYDTPPDASAVVDPSLVTQPVIPVDGKEPIDNPSKRIPFVRPVRGGENPSDSNVPTNSEPAGWNEAQYLEMYPDVAAAVQRGELPSGLAHYYSSGKAEGRQSDFSAPVVNSDTPPTPVPDDATEPAPTPAPETPADEPTPDTTSELEVPAAPEVDEQAQQEAAAAQEQEQEEEAALATATAAKHSAKESRMKKLMSMRKPWSSGASSSTGSDAMVAPPITPSSQIPPPPL